MKKLKSLEKKNFNSLGVGDLFEIGEDYNPYEHNNVFGGVLEKFPFLENAVFMLLQKTEAVGFSGLPLLRISFLSLAENKVFEILIKS